MQGPEVDGQCQTFWRAETGQHDQAVVVAGECSSALDAAWQLADSELLRPWDALLAVSQSQGRGRMRRMWKSPPGNLYVAWLWPKLEPEWMKISSLLAGLAMCEALKPRLPEVQLKWPNDLLADELKVGGILVEERGGKLMVGFGLNLSSAPQAEELRKDAATEAGFLNTLCGGFGPLGLWLEISTLAKQCVEDCLSSSPLSALVKVERHMAWRGLAVRVRREDGTELTGVLQGLARDGGLRLLADGPIGGREQVLYSGSILPLY
ncbi:MAG: biotin--[acetyl-CoA-carboxylase] ligase [Okeania sp. SIO3B3]|nr:biotin--[acetyl-CoA-carboxylase] ligase [Okeania sp. SIO3B3]